MPLYLGVAATAQSVSAVVIEVRDERRRIVFQRTLNFHRDLPEYSVASRTADAAVAPSVMWADAIDRVMSRLATAAEIDLDDIRAMSGSLPASARHGEGEAATIALAPAVSLAPQLAKLPAPVHIDLERLLTGAGGRLASYWQRRYALPGMVVVPWTDDHSSSRIGNGIIHESSLMIALGTNDIVTTSTGVLSFRNGSLARDWVRREYGLQWDAVAKVLDDSPSGDDAVMLPWVEREETPPVKYPGLRRFGFDRHDPARNVRGLIEGQMMAMANHVSTHGGAAIDKIIATGDAAGNRSILQVMANVFGADVYRRDADNAAALGAALRAYHADRLAVEEPITWQTAVAGFTDPNPGHRVVPNPKHVARYAALRRDYAMLERLHKDRRPIC